MFNAAVTSQVYSVIAGGGGGGVEGRHYAVHDICLWCTVKHSFVINILYVAL